MSTGDLFTRSRQWSPQQLAVFDAVGDGRGHLVVRARAGSGKTTTIIEALARAPRLTRPLLLAFNKSIASELEKRAPRHVDVCTLHSLGFKAVQRIWPGTKVDNKTRNRRLAERALPRQHARRAGEIVPVISLCKARLESDPDAIARTLRAHQVAIPGMTDRDLVRAVLEAMAAAADRDGTVSFDDMVFVPALAQVPTGEYDLVLVDETQDMSRAQLALARSALAPGGRLVLVGDDRQAIYGWRGADVGGMDRMRAELDARELPLSVTYRCARGIAALAADVVPDFEAAPGAPAGDIVACHVGAAEWVEGDAVLSRTNAPLVTCALAALRAGRRARIQGREWGSNLKSWVRGLGGYDVAGLLRIADGWVRDELAKLDEDDADAAAELLDKVETLKALAEGAPTVDAVLARIDSLFSDDGPGLVFSSVHRAKGLEFGRVWLLAWTFRPERSEEESNLAYVAVTRAQRTLVFVTGDRAIGSELIRRWIRRAAPMQGAAA